MQEINLPLKVFAAGEEPTGERISHHDNALDEAHASGGVDQCKAITPCVLAEAAKQLAFNFYDTFSKKQS
ncbi:hypothetical protein Bca4012_043829 [Brassica carinata]|nr:hypothetical protein Bca52824_058565 [Brassica carinata]